MSSERFSTQIMNAIFSPPKFDRKKMAAFLAEEFPGKEIVIALDPGQFKEISAYLLYRLDVRTAPTALDIVTPFGNLSATELCFETDSDDDPWRRPFVSLDEAIDQFETVFRRDNDGDLTVDQFSSTPNGRGGPLQFLTDSGDDHLFLMDVLQVYGLEKIGAPFDLAMNGIIRICAATEKVVALAAPQVKWLDRTVIHCADGPAIVWPSGVKEYYWKGYRVPSYFITQRKRLSFSRLSKIENSDLRRCYVEIFGPENLVSHSRLLSKDKFGELYEFNQGVERRDADGYFDNGDLLLEEDVCFVKVKNGTKNKDGSDKFYYLFVPDGMSTAHEAVAWTYGMSKSEYNPDVRT